MRAAMGEHSTSSPLDSRASEEVREGLGRLDASSDEVDAALETARKIERFRESATVGNAERIWALIEPELAEPPPKGPLQAAIALIRRLAIRANITGRGWGGPIAVFLFAAVVVATLLLFRSPLS